MEGRCLKIFQQSGSSREIRQAGVSPILKRTRDKNGRISMDVIKALNKVINGSTTVNSPGTFCSKA